MFFSTALLIVLALFWLAPTPDGVYLGEDFAVFRSAAQRVARGNTDLYQVDAYSAYTEYSIHIYYYNPPWTAVLLLPFLLIPERLGWAVFSTSTLFITMALTSRWLKNQNVIIPILAILSPPTIQIIIHGQIDAFIVATVFLPYTAWPLTALMKPQTGIALLAGIPRAKWLSTAVISGTVFLISLCIFDLWPMKVLQSNVAEQSNNVWKNIWPYPLAAGCAATALGIRNHDERWLVIASPFLFPYASLHSLYGMWVALLTLLHTWQSILLWAAWWALTISAAIK